MLPGLHATLASLTKNLGRREHVALTLFYQDIDAISLEELRGTVEDAGGVGALDFREADVTDFKHLRSLQGDWMTYLRLYLPRLLPDAATILYLDSDLVVNTDASAFFDVPLGEAPIGAIDGGTVLLNLDGAFLKTVGLQDDDRSFNAGVLLINAELWRTGGLIEQTMAFGKKHSEFLRSADQTILNALFARSFCPLPAHLNIAVLPQEARLPDSNGIFHFVGSPKPWDPLGRFFHGNWQMWRDVIVRTRFRWSHFLRHHVSSFALRAWTLRRSYLRTLRRRLGSA
jgi:lipopolysaccharide biosynthesis glycosyltransferase